MPATAKTPTKGTPVPKLERIGPRPQMMSKIPIINRLKRLLPKASPAARSAPSDPPIIVTEVIPVPNSGKEVAVASNTTPIKERPNPVLKAIMSADLANCVAETRITAAKIAKVDHKIGNEEKSKMYTNFY